MCNRGNNCLWNFCFRYVNVHIPSFCAKMISILWVMVERYESHWSISVVPYLENHWNIECFLNYPFPGLFPPIGFRNLYLKAFLEIATINNILDLLAWFKLPPQGGFPLILFLQVTPKRRPSYIWLVWKGREYWHTEVWEIGRASCRERVFNTV